MARAEGKKVGQLVVDAGETKAKFDLRLDIHRSEFLCVHQGVTYKAGTVDKLRDTMRDVVAAESSVTWTRYIEIEYHSSGPRDGDYYGGSCKDLDEKAPEATKELRLDWEIVEYSNPHIPVGDNNDEMVVLERSVDSEGQPGHVKRRHRVATGRGRHRDNNSFSIPAHAVKFTPERLEVLQQLRNALTHVDYRLRRFFGSTSETIAAAMDGGLGALGLPALPPPERPPVVHKRRCALNDPPGCDCGAEDTALPGEAVTHDEECATQAEPECDCGADDDED